jgi:hypothetical protein
MSGTRNATKLLEAAMIILDAPRIQSIEGTLLEGHCQAIGRPAFAVAVWVDTSVERAEQASGTGADDGVVVEFLIVHSFDFCGDSGIDK